jgi:hypothetical protein
MEPYLTLSGTTHQGTPWFLKGIFHNTNTLCGAPSEIPPLMQEKWSLSQTIQVSCALVPNPLVPSSLKETSGLIQPNPLPHCKWTTKIWSIPLFPTTLFLVTPIRLSPYIWYETNLYNWGPSLRLFPHTWVRGGSLHLRDLTLYL